MTSPFKFLDAYTPADRAVFFGREQEVEALYNLLFRTPLVLVHGLSGTGKTSLIQCGLAGRYEGPDWYPFFISRGLKDINEALRGELQKALPGQPVGDDLPGYIRQITEYYYSPVYLIFDQFEELFILGSPEERQQFADNLKAVLDAELSCKVLLVMREEYLGRLYEMEQKIPFLFDFRLRVEPMNMTRVQQVLDQSFTAFNIALEPPPEARFREIITRVSGERSGIELPYLQVYLDLLYKKDFRDTYPGRERNGQLLPLTLTRDKIEAFGRIEDVLEKFLLQQEQELQAALAAEHRELPPNTVRQVLDLFVTDEGTKQPQRFQRDPDTHRVELDERARKLVPELSSAALSDALQALEQSRLLRFLDDTIELAHDKLAALIHAQRTEAQRRLARARARLKFALEEHQLSGAFLNREQLADLEQYLPQLHIEPDMQAFLAANRAFLTQEEAREKRRQRRFIAGVLLVALVSVAAAVVSYGYFLRAQESEELALDKEQDAIQARDSAQSLNRQLGETLTQIQEKSDSLANAKLRSDSLTNIARAETDRANRALNEALESLLREAERHIRVLDYEAAWSAILSAGGLGIRSRTVANALMEIAYYWIEGHQFAVGRELTEATARFYGKEISIGAIPATDSLQILRAVLQALSPERFTVLGKRYYPTMIPIRGGTFMMGCDTKADSICGDDEVLHQASVGDFAMAATETTVWQFSLYCAAEGLEVNDYYYGSWKVDGDLPVINISWYDAVRYGNWLSQQKGLQEIMREDNDIYRVEVRNTNGFRLPTEAEWEYAAREGGRPVIYGNGKNIADPAEINFYPELTVVYSVAGEYRSRTTPVGLFPPNDLGLFDMSGNVWEWCWDWYGDYPEDPVGNYTGPDSGSGRVLRGGSWYFNASYARASDRDSRAPISSYVNYGFRLARAVSF